MPASFEQIDDADEERALREAEAAARAGRVISHDAVVAWLRSWGTRGELPRPKGGK
jgi:predicted transcriptional regulator